MPTPGFGNTDLSVRRRYYEESSGEVQFNGIPGNQILDSATTLQVNHPLTSGMIWTPMRNFVFHATGEMMTQQPGAYIEYYFQGAEIQLIGSTGWNHGSFIVELDGVQTPVNGHCCAAAAGGLTGGILPQQIKWKGTGLNNETGHYIRITNGLAGPAGNAFTFDSFLVFQDIPNAQFSSVVVPSNTYTTPTTSGTTTQFPTGGSSYTNSKGEVKVPQGVKSVSSAPAGRSLRGTRRWGWVSMLTAGLALGTAVQILL